MKNKIVKLLICCILLTTFSVFAQNSVPVIDTVHVSQSQGTTKVDISYSVVDFDSDNLLVLMKVSDDGGISFNVPAQTFTGDYGFGVNSGINKQIIWDAGKDYPEIYGENFQVKLFASDVNIKSINVIPQGNFTMGEGIAGTDNPVHEITLNEFGICPHAVTNEEYKLFCDITDHEKPPAGDIFQAPETYFENRRNYPVVDVSWYDAVTYCNWLSEVDKLEPCYNLTTWAYDSSKNGYHLPTEAQWEKASRGGLDNPAKIFPWGDESPGNRCNYIGYAGILQNEMADFDGLGNGTLPVDSLISNGYGLLNIVGNVWEWCNDWYLENYYYNSPSTNPLGPSTGTEKVIRGGAWNTSEEKLHCATRNSRNPGHKRFDIGFRIAR